MMIIGFEGVLVNSKPEYPS